MFSLSNRLRKSIFKMISEHFLRHRKRSPWAFCWRIGVESVIVAIVLVTPLYYLIDSPHRSFGSLTTTEEFFVTGILVAPVLETLIFQAFPIFVVRLLNGSFRLQILISTSLFAADHFSESIYAGIGAGIIGGLYYAFAYAHWRNFSRWKAFSVTAVSHSIHNAIILLDMLRTGYWNS